LRDTGLFSFQAFCLRRDLTEACTREHQVAFSEEWRREALACLDAVAEDIGGSPLLLANVHLTRARCLERMGRDGDAVAEHRLFVALRSNGDPDQMKSVATARERIAALRKR